MNSRRFQVGSRPGIAIRASNLALQANFKPLTSTSALLAGLEPSTGHQPWLDPATVPHDQGGGTLGDGRNDGRPDAPMVSATGGEPTAPSDQLGVAALRRWPAPLVMVVDLARHIARRQLHGVVDREVHRHCRLHRAWRCAGDNDGEGTERLANQTGQCDTSADRCDPWPRAEPFLVNECRRTSSHRMNGTLGDQRRSPTAPVGCGLRRF
jgi:hypothetical protein